MYEFVNYLRVRKFKKKTVERGIMKLLMNEKISNNQKKTYLQTTCKLETIAGKIYEEVILNLC